MSSDHDRSDGQGIDAEKVFGSDTVQEHRTFRQRLVSTLIEDKMALFGAIAVIIITASAVFAPVVAPYEKGTVFESFQPPNSYSETDYDLDGEMERVWHPLGTDSLGHDILTRLIYGARISLMVAFATMGLAFVLGVSIGLAAGYHGGWIDNVLMRYIDFQWAFPELILAVALIAYVGDIGVINVVIAIGLAYVDDFARLVRSEVLAIREEEYIMAARAIGMPNYKIMASEVLPNAVAPLIVQATIIIPLAILSEAGLSFLGLGVQPSTPTWGLILSDGKRYIYRAWWISIMPGFAIMATVLAFNMLGDGLRDTFDIQEAEVKDR